MARAKFWSERHGLRLEAEDSRLVPGAPLYHPLVGVLPKCPLCGAPRVNMSVVRLQGFFDDGCRQLVATVSCCGGYIDFDEHSAKHVDERGVHQLEAAAATATPLFLGADPKTPPPPAAQPDDPVSHPAHYTFGTLEVIEVIEDWGWGLAFCLGNAVKYIARAGRKDPTKTKEDLEKARWYLDRAIQIVTKGG